MRILHAADLHLWSEPTVGRINPETGLAVRWEDQLRLLHRLVDVAIDEHVDLVAISGDLFHRSKPSPLEYRAAFDELQRLDEAGIPTVVIAGNHDGAGSLPGQISAVDVLRPVVAEVVSKGPVIRMFGSDGEVVQVVALPHLHRSHLLTGAAKDLSPEATYALLSQKTMDLLRALQVKRDLDVPAILMTHVAVSGATLGSEVDMGIMAASSIVLPLPELQDLRYDVLALGHIHKHQFLEENAAYGGSLWRVSFGEEKQPKGAILWTVDGRRVASRFIDLEDRPYVTLDVHGATEGLADIDGAVVRVTGTLTAEEAATIDGTAFCRQLEAMGALVASWQVETARTAAARVSAMTETLGPAEALDLYLREHPELPQDAVRDRGRSLIQGQAPAIDVGSGAVPANTALPTPVEVTS